ncbi:gp157 [Sphingomonas phage PAU]|uniref:gp157 n=1 Tax=Sphingomonas phage PAU TaxID=1150991 RepID=UPI00025732E9|nr:gp157 [Sphingomonas phage PAU]AFF28155.1 gp157 [Sphingomonas phage PAU]
MDKKIIGTVKSVQGETYNIRLRNVLDRTQLLLSYEIGITANVVLNTSKLPDLIPSELDVQMYLMYYNEHIDYHIRNNQPSLNKVEISSLKMI